MKKKQFTATRRLRLSFAILLVLVAAHVVTAASTGTVDLSKVIGTVSKTFYGAQVGSFGANPSFIDVDGDGYPETQSDYQAHRTAMTEAKISYIRRDMWLQGAANSDGTFKSYNIDPVKTQVIWASQNNMKVLLEADFMPTWLADNSPNCVSDRTRCAPKDYARWGKLVVDYLDYVTENGKYANAVEIEVWNEPYQPKFLAPEGTAQDRINIYNKLYPATRNAIKAKYPNILVGGPPGWYATSFAKTFTDNFLTTFPASQVDFVSLHHYSDNMLSTDIQKAIANVKAKGHGKNIKFTEYNVYSAPFLLAKTNEHEAYLAETLMDVLNYAPQVSSMVLYHWSETTKYSNTWAYPEYPRRSSMFSEPKLDNAKYTGFYVTRDFGTFHAGGSSIVSSSSAVSGIKFLTTKSGSTYYLTILNRNVLPAPVTVTFSGQTISSIKDVNTNTAVSLNGNTANFGSIAAYDVRHYIVTVSTPPPPPPPTNGPVYLSIEAENPAAVYAPMTLQSDPSASGGEYIMTQNGAGVNGKAVYTLTVPKTGTYKLLGKVIAPNINDDSFTVQMDGGTVSLWDVQLSSSWMWDEVTDRNNNGLVNNYYLTAGTHTLTITQREDGTKLDVLMLTNDLAYRSSSDMHLPAEAGTLSAPMQVYNDNNAVGGRYIMGPDVIGQTGRAVYSFYLPKAGNYKVSGRVIAPSGVADSFFAQMDSDSVTIWDTQLSTNWVWDDINDRADGGNRVVYALQAGQHTLTITQRDPNTKLDELVVTSDMSFSG